MLINKRNRLSIIHSIFLNVLGSYTNSFSLFHWRRSGTKQGSWTGSGFDLPKPKIEDNPPPIGRLLSDFLLYKSFFVVFRQ